MFLEPFEHKTIACEQGVFAPVLSVVIPTHQRFERLLRCLRSLARQTMDWRSVQVIVVTNLEEPLVRQYLSEAKWPLRLELHATGQVGVNRARNKGLSFVQAPVVLFLDDDCELLDKRHFEKIIALHAHHEDTIAIGGGYQAPGQQSHYARAYHEISQQWFHDNQSPGGASTDLLGGNVSYKTAWLRDQNLFFDESIEFGGAETELHRRLLAQNLKLKALAPEVLHHLEIDRAGFYKKAFLQGRGRKQSLPPVEPIKTTVSRELSFSEFEYRIWFQRGQHQQRALSFGALQVQIQFWWISILWLAFLAHERIRKIFWLSYSLALRIRGRIKGVAIFLYWRGYKLYCLLRYDLAPKMTKEFQRQLLGLDAQDVSRPLAYNGVPGFYLPVYAGCEAQCSYCGVLRAKKNGANTLQTNNLQQFKNMGLSKAILPCNVFSLSEQQTVRIRKELAEFTSEILVNPDFFKSFEEFQNRMLRLHAQGYSFSILSRPGSMFKTVLRELQRIQNDVRVVHVLGLSGNLKILETQISDEEWGQVELLSSLDRPLEMTDARNSQTARQLAQLAGVAQRRPKMKWPSTSSLHFPFASPQHEVVAPSVEITFSQTTMTLEPMYSFIIPVKNQVEHLMWVLRSLTKLNYPRSQFEIIVIDDGNDIPVGEKVKELWESLAENLSIKVIHWSRKKEDGSCDNTYRAGQSRNLGVSFASGKRFVFLDSDIVVSSQFLAHLDDHLKEGVLIQFPRHMLNREASENFVDYDSIEAHRHVYAQDSYWEKFKATENWESLKNYWKYTCTYTLCLTRETFNSVGPFRPDYVYYGFEDVDLGYRLYQKGTRFKLLKDPVYHLYPDAESSFHFDKRKRFESLSRSAGVFFQRNLDLSFYFDLNFYLYRPLSVRLKKPYYFLEYQINKWRRPR